MDTSNAIVIQREGELSVHLVARDPQEMAASQAHLATWLDAKCASLVRESEELFRAVETAMNNKWASSALKNQLRKADNRLKYYSKLKDAVLAGYTIIPDFPAQVFAIRTKREKPTREHVVLDDGHAWQQPETPDQKAETLPTGQGDYKSPVTEDQRWVTAHKNSEGKDVQRQHVMSEAFAEIDFPLIAARPDVMTATQEAMALRVFDEIAISPSYRRKADPIIIGKIYGPKVGYQQKSINFLIAWHLDLREL